VLSGEAAALHHGEDPAVGRPGTGTTRRGSRQPSQQMSAPSPSTGATPPRLRTAVKRGVRVLAFVLGAALLGYLLYGYGSARVWLDLQALGWRLAVIVALEVLVSAMSAQAWWYTLPRQTRHGCWRRLFAVQVAGSALNETAPGAPLYGEPVKVLLLKERFPVAVTTASLLSAKLAQALARVLFVSLGMVAATWLLRYDRLPVKSLTIGFLLTAAGVVAFLILQVRGLSGPARQVLARLHFLGGWVERVEQGLGRVDAHLQELYGARPWDFVASLLLCFGGLGVGIVQIWLVMVWMGLEADWAASFAIEAFSVLVSFVSFPIPGALGVQEGGKLLIFAALGLPLSAGLSVGVAFRLNNLVNMGIGLAVLAWLRPHRVLRAARVVEATHRSRGRMLL
jgi:uncharacterized protein (TIRG00374 family)